MTSTNRVVCLAPPIPYTDTYRYVASPLSSAVFGMLEALAALIRRGEGEAGIAPDVWFYHLTLDQSFHKRFPNFKDVEEIWIAVDLDALMGGKE